MNLVIICMARGQRPRPGSGGSNLKLHNHPIGISPMSSQPSIPTRPAPVTALELEDAAKFGYQNKAGPRSHVCVHTY
jgi:hypothetical protein